jgi:hypothetical protein
VQAGDGLHNEPDAWFTLLLSKVMPGLSWQKLFDSLIENTEEMKTITDFPLLLVNLSKAKGLWAKICET